MRRRKPTTALCSTGSRTSIFTVKARGTDPSSQVWLDRIRTDKKAMGKRQLRATVTLVIVGLACAPRPARAQAVFKVGTFFKSACTAPCNEVNQPHGLGVQPQVLILWTSGATVENFNGANYWWAFGVTDGTTSRSTSPSSKPPSS